MEKSKTSFVFFTEWRHLIADLSPEVKIEIYEGISDYAETGVVPDMSPVAAAVFPFIKKEIDEKNKQNNEISQKRRNARNKHNKTKKNDNTQQNSTKTDFVDDCKAKTETADNTQQNSTKSDFVSICKTDTKKNDNTQQNPKDEKAPFNGFLPNNPLSLISEKEEKKERKENTPKGVQKKSEKVESGLRTSENPSPPGSAPPPSPIEKRERTFRDGLVPFVSKYGEEMIRAFCDYWTERNKSGTKMRFEMEKTWDTARRLVRWDMNNNKFKRDYAGNTKPVYGNKAPEEFGKGYWSDDI